MRQTKWMYALVAVALLTTSCNKEQTKEKNIVKVKTVAIGQTNISGEQSYAGTIEEESGTSLSFAGMGTIKSINVHEGQNVSAGQLIGEIDASSTGNALTMAHATTQQAKESLKQAEDAYNRMKMLHDNGSLPEMKWVEVTTKVSQAKQMLEQALASEKIAQKGVNDTRLTAPFSGYISQKTAEVGQNVTPGQPVAKLVKIDRVNVKISVPEDEIIKIKIGEKINFQVASLGQENFTGTICEKSVTADPISRAYTVKASLANPKHKLLPGMVCDVYASSGNHTLGMMLPANIIQIDIDNKPFVWTVKNGVAQRVSVELGENVGENIIIKNGLSQGEKVIVEGQQKVSNGMKVCEQK